MIQKNKYVFLKTFICIPAVLIFGFILQNIGFFFPSIANVPFLSFIDGMHQWLDINYFEFGFIRRAFIGTLISFLNNSIGKVCFSSQSIINGRIFCSPNDFSISAIICWFSVVPNLIK